MGTINSLFSIFAATQKYSVSQNNTSVSIAQGQASQTDAYGDAFSLQISESAISAASGNGNTDSEEAAVMFASYKSDTSSGSATITGAAWVGAAGAKVAGVTVTGGFIGGGYAEGGPGVSPGELFSFMQDERNALGTFLGGSTASSGDTSASASGAPQGIQTDTSTGVPSSSDSAALDQLFALLTQEMSSLTAPSASINNSSQDSKDSTQQQPVDKNTVST